MANLPVNRLLLEIKTGLTEDEYRDLLSLYNVEPSEETKRLDELKSLVSSNKLTTSQDWDEMYKNLITLRKNDLADKVEEFVGTYFTPPVDQLAVPVLETMSHLQAVGAGHELHPNTVPVPESNPPSHINMPIEQTGAGDGLSELQPIPSTLRQSTIPQLYQQKKTQPARKKPRLGADPANVTDDPTREDDSTSNSEEEEEEEEEIPIAEGDDLTFMQLAIEVSMKSPDPNTKVGAVLVNNGRVIGEGCNRMPRGREDIPFNSTGSNEEDKKYAYVTHAAVVAIRNAYKKKEDVAGSTLYVTMYPASRDGVEIVEAELKEMVYMHEMREENRKRYNTGATKRLLDYDVVTRQVRMP